MIFFRCRSGTSFIQRLHFIYKLALFQYSHINYCFVPYEKLFKNVNWVTNDVFSENVKLFRNYFSFHSQLNIKACHNIKIPKTWIFIFAVYLTRRNSNSKVVCSIPIKYSLTLVTNTCNDYVHRITENY